MGWPSEEGGERRFTTLQFRSVCGGGGLQRQQWRQRQQPVGLGVCGMQPDFTTFLSLSLCFFRRLNRPSTTIDHTQYYLFKNLASLVRFVYSTRSRLRGRPPAHCCLEVTTWGLAAPNAASQPATSLARRSPIRVGTLSPPRNFPPPYSTATHGRDCQTLGQVCETEFPRIMRIHFTSSLYYRILYS